MNTQDDIDRLGGQPQSTETLTHSWLQSSATVRHLMRHPVLRLSLTKSMLHTSLTVLASCSGTRSLTGRLDFLRLPIAEAPTCMRDLDDLAAELLRQGIGRGWIAIAVAGEPHKPAGASFAQIALLDHGGDGGTLGLWG
ncbi:MAG: hypothetical protein EON56_05625 [Alphaproteobacteria bacterium]|nr:MAG: hypothetical protein EON56_05625 [Alphaproteobacteria bacterium]